MNFVGVDACKKGWFMIALYRQDDSLKPTPG
jgi:hypothetical protein